MMTTENKCCKTCKNFKDEDADGYGWCELQQEEVIGYFSYPCHEPLNNGWTEITPDNVDKIRKNKGNIVVMNPKEWNVPEMLYSYQQTLWCFIRNGAVTTITFYPN